MEVFLVPKGFLLNDIPDRILKCVKEYCLKSPDEETCGIIYSQNGRLEFLSCPNLSWNKKNSFCIDLNIIVDYNVKYIFHSHIDCCAKPSLSDKNSSNELAIPFLIYSILYDKFEIYQNKSV